MTTVNKSYPKGEYMVSITQAQLSSIIALKDDVNSMIGTADDDRDWKRHIRNIERFLKNNKIKQ